MSEINKTELLNLTKQLIGFKSITPHQAGSIDFIQAYLEDLKFKTIRLDRNDTSNLFAIWEYTDSEINQNTAKTLKPIIAFAGHVDIVPTGDITKWQFDPFELTEHNGLLYGRGIADMKGAIASFMYATHEYINSIKTQKHIKNLVNNNTQNNSNIAIAFAITSDEEGHAVDGTPVIVEYLKQQNITLDYCIIGEPSCFNVLGDVIKVGRRGSLTAHLEILGKQGHVAYPELCTNPIHKFAPALNELSSTRWDNGNECNEYFPATSLQFTNINSGIGVNNVVPNNLLTDFNLRYNTSISPDSIKEKVYNILNKYELQYNITWNHSAAPFLAKHGKLLKAVTEAIELQSWNNGITPLLKTDGGTSDGRFLIEVCHELLEFGLNNKYIHQINESIKTSDLLQLTQVYHTVLTLLDTSMIK
jgi:succinyl-diaminopimelate desuccinylase